MHIDNCEGPRLRDRLLRSVKRVARATPGAARASLAYVWGLLLATASMTAPIVMTTVGVIVMQGWKSNASLMGSNLVWWLGTACIGFGMSGLYARGVDDGKSRGMMAMAKHSAEALLKVSGRKIDIAVDHHLNIIDSRPGTYSVSKGEGEEGDCSLGTQINELMSKVSRLDVENARLRARLGEGA